MDISNKTPNIMNYITPDMDIIKPGKHSHMGLNVPSIILEHGSLLGKLKTMPYMLKDAIGCITEIKASYRAISNQPNQAKRNISADELNDLTDYIHSTGVDMIGFAKVDPNFIFSDKAILYENAIVLLLEMKPEIIATAPSLDVNKEIFRTYHGLGVCVNRITEYLKTHGFNAQAGPALGGEVNYPLLAEKAGLGAIGNHGLLITESLGPSLRIAVVYTDIENLPLNKNNDHMWIKDFCKTCGRCTKNCPANAIYETPTVFDDGSQQHIDYKKCAIPFSNDYGCTVCVRSCTFFSGDYARIKKGFLG